MDAWGWTALGPWLAERAALPVGRLFCVIAGPIAGHAWLASAARLQHAVELLREGIRLPDSQLPLQHRRAGPRQAGVGRNRDDAGAVVGEPALLARRHELAPAPPLAPIRHEFHANWDPSGRPREVPRPGRHGPAPPGSRAPR
jgi:hypothetical protein